MQPDKKDAELLEKCADMLHELYNYIHIVSTTHHKRMNLDEKFESLRTDIKLIKKQLK